MQGMCEYGDPLTRREEAIVACVFRGLSNDAIAGELGICEQRVRNYLRFAMRKLGVSGRYELISQAHAAGGLALWTYERSEAKPAAEMKVARPKVERPIERPIERPSWFSRFIVAPTTHEERLIRLVLANPDLEAWGIARRISGSSERGVQVCLSRIYNKAGVKTRAGLIAFLLRPA